MIYLLLTIYFVEALHLWFVVKIFPDEATPDKYAEQSEKNNKKFIIFKQTSGLFLMYYDGNGTWQDLGKKEKTNSEIKEKVLSGVK